MRPLVIATALAALAAVVALRSRSSEPLAARTTPAPLAEPASDPLTLAAWSGSSRDVPFHARANTQRPVHAASAPGRAEAGSEEPASPERRAIPARTVAPKRAPRTSGSPAEFLADALFRRLDANGDGVLTGSEIPSELRAAVGRGTLDVEAFAKLFQTTVERLRTAAAEAPAVSDWFESLDVDGTGQVPLSRWRAAGGNVAEFRRMDADGDGVLTRREVQAFASQAVASGAAPSALQAPRGGTPTADGSKGASRAASDVRRAPTEAQTRTKADEIFEHYTAVAAGIAPPMSRGVFASATSKPAPAKPQAAAPAPSPAAAKPAAKPAPSPSFSATLPMPIAGIDYWVIRNAENVTALLAGAKPNVLFLGDSITDRLANGPGKPLWADTYAPLGALDFAVNGLTTSNVLWQVETGQVALAAPKVVVLLIGSNNLGLGQKPQEAAAGVAKIVNEIEAQLPDARILLLGILPRGAATDALRPAIAETNRLIDDFDKSDRVTYLDIGKWFVSRDRSIAPEVMPDGLHPSLYGYELYTLAIWDTLTELLSQSERK